MALIRVRGPVEDVANSAPVQESEPSEGDLMRRSLVQRVPIAIVRLGRARTAPGMYAVAAELPDYGETGVSSESTV